MRFKRNIPKENAYLTVYLSLVFGIVLSLLLALIEGAAIGAVRAQAELVADLGLDSVFAEYNREILDQYELFFIDSSYGSDNGGVGMVESHLSTYMQKNMDPDDDVGSFGGKTYLKLTNPYLEIKEASFASDNYGEVWKAQAVAYMKAVYGGDIVDTVKEHMETVQSNSMDTRDVTSELSEQVTEFEQSLNDSAEITEYDTEADDGSSYSKIDKFVDKILQGSFLKLVTPSGSSVSQTSVNINDYYSARVSAGKANSGVGLHDGADAADGTVDELLYGEYLMKMCGNYIDQKDNGLLSYQIEYILYGGSSDAANIASCAARLYAIRSVGNVISIYQSSSKQATASAVASVVCAILLAPELEPALKQILLVSWALAESAMDVKSLLGGGKVPLIKKDSQWTLSLSSLIAGNFSGDSSQSDGLSYQAYLRVLLALMNKQNKAARSLDIVEMDIRQTQGNESFRIDRCIDYIKVGFGFADASGHDFVFERTMCYE